MSSETEKFGWGTRQLLRYSLEWQNAVFRERYKTFVLTNTKHKLWEYERLYSIVESIRANNKSVIPIEVALKLPGNLY